MDFGPLIALGFAAVGVTALAQLVWGFANLPQLRDVPPARPPVPRVSIVVAARDEERHIEEAVRALLGLEYPDYEIIVVNDRSTDRTPEILAALSAAEPRVQVVTVTELPPGWIGKNHALHLGAARATGELILFADGDIVFERYALARAVRLLELENADHLTIAPELELPSIGLELLVTYAFMWGFIALRPWKTSDPSSSASAGIGAFQLVRAETYHEIGGHTRIRLRPDDDLKLGLLIKRSGFRQIVALGLDEIRVEWYRTIGEAAYGFRKNAFAVLEYRVPLAVGSVLVNTLSAWVFIAPFVTTGAERTLYMVAAGASMAAYAYHAYRNRWRVWLAPLYPVAGLMTAWIVADVVIRNLRAGAIEWRGTFYPIEELRKNRV